MPLQPTIVANRPQAFSQQERREFMDLVIAGGEVGNAVLETNVNKARCLVLLRLQKQLLGVAALKNPRSTYRTRIERNSGTDLGAHTFPYELGYVFVIEGARGRGYSGQLTAAALSACDRRGVFATSRSDNHQMHASLRRHGFSQAGQSYTGRSPQQLFYVFLRPPVQD
jgi:predicted GNAT family N-acyltransferase